MPYLQSILDTEKSAKKIVETAEQEAATLIAQARKDISKKEQTVRDACAAERATILEKQASTLATAHEKILTQARDEVKKIRDRVLPKQKQAIAHIKVLMVE